MARAQVSTDERLRPKRRRPIRRRLTRLEQAERHIVDVSEDFQYLRILVYAKPKRGKTTFGASGPKPIVIDCNEKGTLSIRRVPDCKVFKVNTWTDIDLAYWYLHGGNHDRETVVIDTVTSLAALCMKFVLGDEESRDPTRDPEMPSRQVWGKVGELMKTMVIQFRNLPMNVVFLAQERKGFNDEEDDEPEIYPDVSPSIRNSLTPAVDIIGRLYVKEVKTKGDKVVWERRLLIGDHESYTTGDRSNSGLPRIIRNPDLSQMLRRIREAS